MLTSAPNLEVNHPVLASELLDAYRRGDIVSQDEIDINVQELAGGNCLPPTVCRQYFFR
jgi:hypothetical protein